MRSLSSYMDTVLIILYYVCVAFSFPDVMFCLVLVGGEETQCTSNGCDDPGDSSVRRVLLSSCSACHLRLRLTRRFSCSYTSRMSVINPRARAARRARAATSFSTHQPSPPSSPSPTPTLTPSLTPPSPSLAAPTAPEASEAPKARPRPSSPFSPPPPFVEPPLPRRRVSLRTSTPSSPHTSALGSPSASQHHRSSANRYSLDVSLDATFIRACTSTYAA